MMTVREVDNMDMDPRTEKMLAENAQRVAATPAPLRGPLRVLGDARRWARTHATATKLLAGAVMAVLFAVYYLGVTVPAQRADRLQMDARAAERLKAATASRQDSVAECLSKAQTEADARWTAACKARRQGANCPLPEAQADAFDHAETAARNACLLGR